MMDSSEDMDLKRLLTSWHCEILYNLFREEDITIEELKHIKYRHINVLLKTYKMGVRIRFEHYLESWRNRVGTPLSTDGYSSADNSATCNCKRGRYQNDIKTEMNGQVECSRESTENNDPPIDDSPARRTPYLLRRKTITKTERSISDAEEHQASETKDDELYNPYNNIGSSRRVHNNCQHSLTQILQRSGARGMALVQYYDEHNEFTNLQRSQLIQLICDFYESNEYHLSLHMSHALELEILQLFPTEKLQYYRTEKRGKIYVKFTNMKRTRKDRSSNNAANRSTLQKTKTDDSHISVVNMADMNESRATCNTDAVSNDTWPEAVEPDIVIKSGQGEES
ncbi:uncharacterized protein LOC142238564 [Haematobia irritans]|uniref:uncharacterized protein LOC142238564 n=1 Tax=Haematobia irritans TaxID=7368 RepID=UPI003F4F6668